MSDPSIAPQGAQGDNTAWVTVEVPAPPGEVLAFCRDIARVVRLNPYLEIRGWEEFPGPFAPGKRYRLHALNEWTGIERDQWLTVEAVADDGFRLAYPEGQKLALEVRVAPLGEGCALTLREHYRTPESDAQLKEVDRSITPWGVGIRRHLAGMRRYARLPGYRWTRGIVLGMRPRERRITRLIVWVTALEFVVFLFVIAIFWSEMRR